MDNHYALITISSLFNSDWPPRSGIRRECVVLICQKGSLAGALYLDTRNKMACFVAPRALGASPISLPDGRWGSIG